VQQRLTLDVTREEADFGFRLAEQPSGVRAVVREIRPGLRAVKVRADDGSTEYAICDDELRPVYLPARSLDDLRRRFTVR
jgi:hypothetical protein